MKFKCLSVVSIIILFNYSCGENPEENLKEFNKIKTDLIINYQDKRNDFNKLNVYFNLEHIKCIEFSKTQILLLRYKTGNNDDNSELNEIRNKDFISPDILAVLKLENLDDRDLMKLKDDLFNINTHRLRIIDYYDNHLGEYSKEIDLLYNKKMNGLSFFYRIFQKPLDSMPNGSYNILINNGTTGAILSNNAVWYYK